MRKRKRKKQDLECGMKRWSEQERVELCGRRQSGKGEHVEHEEREGQEEGEKGRQYGGQEMWDLWVGAEERLREKRKPCGKGAGGERTIAVFVALHSKRGREKEGHYKGKWKRKGRRG